MIIQMSGVTEPIVVTGVLAGGGLVVVWFANKIVTISDLVLRLVLRVEDPQTGAIAMIQRNHTEVQGAMGQLSNDFIQIEKRVSRVEDRCEITHNGNGTG